MKSSMNNVILVVAGAILLSAGITFAAAAWQGTTWISDGSVVDATKIKANFDYLYEQINSGAASLWSQGTAGAIYYTGGNVGVGTTTPGQKLSVAGMVETTTGGIKFPDGTIQTTAAMGATIFSGSLCGLASSQDNFNWSWIVYCNGSSVSCPSGYAFRSVQTGFTAFTTTDGVNQQPYYIGTCSKN